MAMITEIRRKLPLFKHRNNEMSPQGAPDANAVIEIAIGDIIPNRSQPRSAFNQNAIARLADSIRRYGILQPLTVRKVLLPGSAPADGEEAVIYELVAGERRLRAAKLAEFVTVPCIVINTDDATSAELAIIENLLREDLNMFEQAEAFARLIREFHLTQEEAARRVSMSQSAVANKLRILRLSPEERQKILEAGLTERHARALLKLADPALRGDVLEQILLRKMNVSTTEAYIDNILTEVARYRQRSAPVETAELPKEDQKNSEKDEKSPMLEETESVGEVTQETLTPNIDQTDVGEETWPAAIQTVMARRQGRFKASIKDLQLFYNSIHHAVGILNTAGIRGDVAKNEQEDRVTLTITLTKSAE